MPMNKQSITKEIPNTAARIACNRLNIVADPFVSQKMF
jgi:hypothetical protein